MLADSTGSALRSLQAVYKLAKIEDYPSVWEQAEESRFCWDCHLMR